MQDHIQKTTDGVFQGGLLSPFLFSPSINLIMKLFTINIRNGIQLKPWPQMDGLDFTAELIPHSHTQNQLQEKITTVAETLAQLGLRIEERQRYCEQTQHQMLL
jgi:hypothetical protein